MSLLHRFLGIGGGEASPAGESPSVRRIATELDRLPADKARYLAAFAYVMARAANADLKIDPSEVDAMTRATASLANLEASEAQLVVEIAVSQAKDLGHTENYRVTREFKNISNHEQRIALVECLYAVSAADGTISMSESAEVLTIASELGLSRAETNALKMNWKSHLAEFQALERTRKP